VVEAASDTPRAVARPGRGSSDARTDALIGAMLLATAALWVPAHRLHPGGVGFSSTWAVLTLGFVLAGMQATQLHVEIGRQAYSVSLSETPLVIGLVLLAPTWLLIASPLGAAIAMLIQRNAPRKTWFNVALSALEPMVAATVFGGMLTASESGPWMWLAAFVAILVVGTVDGVAVTAVISLQNGRPTPTEVRTAVATFVASATLNTTIALLIVIVLQAEPGGLILVAALGAVLVAAYRAYAKLLRRHESLGLLYEFQEAIDWTAASDELVQELLREARRLLRAERAAIRLAPVDSADHTDVTVMLDEYDRAETVLTGPEVLGTLRARVLADAAVLAPQGTKDAEVRQWLEEQHVRDAMIVPLRAESGVVGTLEVANRLGATGTFTADDLQLLETFGAQAGLALQTGRLLDQLRYDAEYDALTGLANRSRFLHRLELALEEAAGQPGSGPAVLLLDLNRFKMVNDTLGHDVGDRLLRAVGARIAAVVPAQATVARLGGDEYAVLLPRCAAGEADALSVAGAVHQALDQPFPLDGFNLDASAAIGAAYSTEGGLDATTMLARADIAMYAAKKALLPVQTYSAELDQTTPRRLALVGELRHAIDHGGLVLHYQPQVALSTHTLAGVEALVRWQHPLHGLIYPDEFIPLAEHTGLITALTTVVLDTALGQCRVWLDQGRRIGVAVNISVRGLIDSAFPDEVAAVLAATNVPASLLTLELTEGSVMTDPSRTLPVLQALHELGVELSIDDFGTGYSSLAYLSQLPVDEVKIDKSFVMQMGSDASSCTIVHAVVDLGRNLGLRVVAEGVEDEASREALTQMGCAVGQGYLFSRPVSAEALQAWLSAGAAYIPAPRSTLIPEQLIPEPAASG
jgi:diguanylate cyclase (GGDEF)-like protein